MAVDYFDYLTRIQNWKQVVAIICGISVSHIVASFVKPETAFFSFFLGISLVCLASYIVKKDSKDGALANYAKSRIGTIERYLAAEGHTDDSELSDKMHTRLRNYVEFLKEIYDDMNKI
jgi:hypothetical protein